MSVEYGSTGFRHHPVPFAVCHLPDLGSPRLAGRRGRSAMPKPKRRPAGADHEAGGGGSPGILRHRPVGFPMSSQKTAALHVTC